MAEYIDKNKILDRLDRLMHIATEPPMDADDKAQWVLLRELHKEFSELPTADVEGVNHGEWIYKHRHRGGFEKKTVYDDFGNPHTVSIDNRYECDEPYCSVCGKLGGDFLNYCGNCGAKMDGGKTK